MAAKDLYLGVDLGGTKIEAAILTAEGEFLARERVTTPSADYPGTLDRISALCTRIEMSVGVKTGLPIGIGHRARSAPKRGCLETATARPLMATIYRRTLHESPGARSKWQTMETAQQFPNESVISYVVVRDFPKDTIATSNHICII